ncbi:MAG: hypothetical protein K2X76_01655 [Sphingomonas sp.]|nr:hypothetical protein [Sphingomonas sp.]
MTQCSDEELAKLIATVQNDPANQLAYVDQAAALYPEDARVHFLRASLLAGSQRPIEAHAAFTRAVALAPDFALARFQLGFFELTSGEAARALASWQPLDAQLPEAHHLRQFVRGLRHLIADEFAACVTALEAGIAANDDNPPLNRDMGLIIEQCRQLIGRQEAAAAPAAEEEASATSFLLGQLGGRGLIH